MKYSLFFYILFMGLCGIYAASRHIRSLPKDSGVMKNLTHSLMTGEKQVVYQYELHCPVPPMECPNDNITFWYYSRVLGEHPIPIRYASSKSSNVNNGPGPWKVLIHGFTENKDTFPVKDLVAAYNEKGLYNILVVDYSPLSQDGCFESTVKNIPLVAKCTAEMLDYLIDNKVFTADQLHVIGYDVGAHVAGALYEYMTTGQLGRISALDPANAMIFLIALKSLSDKSAMFVDAYHTNALLRAELPPTGHAEFFFNSGVVQPPCYEDVEGLLECSHERSALFFIESIRYVGTDNGFYGIPCNDYWWFAAEFCEGSDDIIVKAGESTETNVRGTFHLQTRNKPPYALGKMYKFNPNFIYRI